MLNNRYKITGLNIDRLLNSAVKKGIVMINVKKTDVKTTYFEVPIEYEKKFFDYLKEICYNNNSVEISKSKKGKKVKKDFNTFTLPYGVKIERVGSVGLLSPLYKIFKRFGLIIGAALFIFCAYFFDNTILAIDYVGSGNVLQGEIDACLIDNGVKIFKRFPKDLNGISDSLSKLPEFEFASVKKSGSRLVVETYLQKNAKPIVDKTRLELLAPVSGIIEYAKIYKGTLLIPIGNFVNVGDKIVTGIKVYEDGTEVKTGILAEVSIICNYNFTYKSGNDNEEDFAYNLAKEDLGDREVVDYKIEKFEDNGFTYNVTITYRYLIY